MTDPDRRCGTCRWWERDREYGTCSAPLPACIISVCETHETQGTECPTWIARKDET